MTVQYIVTHVSILTTPCIQPATTLPTPADLTALLRIEDIMRLHVVPWQANPYQLNTHDDDDDQHHHNDGDNDNNYNNNQNKNNNHNTENGPSQNNINIHNDPSLDNNNPQAAHSYYVTPSLP